MVRVAYIETISASYKNYLKLNKIVSTLKVNNIPYFVKEQLLSNAVFVDEQFEEKAKLTLRPLI